MENSEPGAAVLPIEQVPIASLKPHPRNYRAHPEDQLAHIVASIQQHGFYRNVVIARDNTILAGHGVVLAAERLGLADVPVIRLDIDPDDPRALKVLTGDNEISHLGEIDDRALSELLREISQAVDLGGLIGTGYDENMLAGLVYVTRPSSEIQTLSQAAQWVGMPEYDEGESGIQVIVHIRSVEDLARFGDLVGTPFSSENPRPTGLASVWWPPRTEIIDRTSVKFEGSSL